MRFALPPEVLDDPSDTTQRAIARLLDRVVLSVHEVVFEDADKLLASQWYREHPRDQEFLRSLAYASSYVGRSLRVHHDLPLELAVRLAYQPLAVWVENDRSDGKLVAAAVRVYASEKLRTLWRDDPPTGPAIKLEKGGGAGEIKKSLEERAQQAPDELRHRCVVMTDGDARWPRDDARGWTEDTERTSKAKSLRELCENHGIPCIVLSCRTAENYLPDAVLERWASARERVNARPQVEALRRLTPPQRDHISVKRGLSERMDTQSHRELYESVDALDRQALVGFQDDIIAIIDDALLTEQELDSRDLRGDLRRLIKAIEEAL